MENYSVPTDKTMSLDEVIERLTKMRDDGRKGDTPVGVQIPFPNIGWFYVPLINITDDSGLMTLVPDLDATIHTLKGKAGEPSYKGVIPVDED